MSAGLQGAFRALADPTRREIVVMLAAGDRSIAEVAGEFSLTRAAIKKHLTVLAEGGLITVERRGREAVNRLNPSTLKDVADWLSYFDRFWDDKLAALQEAITAEASKGDERDE